MKSVKVERICWLGLLCCAIAFASLYFYPISTFITRWIFIGTSIATMIFVLLIFIMLRKLLLLLMVTIFLAIVLKLFIQSNKTLSQVYVDELNKYVGTEYVWGGENSQGIDCSGLVRKAMINSLIVKSISTLNFSDLRLATHIWWHDCTAKSIKDGFMGYTVGVRDKLFLNENADSLTRVGDLAVTLDGLHIMAYVGNSEWIEADPLLHEVVRVRTPSKNIWFKYPWQIVRWNVLKE